MKKGIATAILVSIVISLCGCECKHEWTAATCTTAVTCSKCGATQGEPLGHKWIEATCTQPKVCEICGMTMGEVAEHQWVEATCKSPKKCSVCRATEGEKLDHVWEAATCTEPKTCSLCGATEGEKLEHSWEPATCTEPETCSVCGATEGKANGHTVENWAITRESTCTVAGEQTGVCTVCGEAITEKLPLAEHIAGEWEITTEPTIDKDGVHVKKCINCGKQLEKESFSLTAEEIKALYAKKCSKLDYDTISRYPGEHKLDYVTFRGKVVQVCYEATSAEYYSAYRVATSGSYDDIVYLLVDNYGSGERILEDDWITVYGRFIELYTYETVMGSNLTIPEILGEYISR